MRWYICNIFVGFTPDIDIVARRKRRCLDDVVMKASQYGCILSLPVIGGERTGAGPVSGPGEIIQAVTGIVILNIYHSHHSSYKVNQPHRPR